MAIVAALIVCALSIARGFRGETFMGRALGGDFVQFYVAGKILNEYDAGRLYDLDLEVDLQHKSAPGTAKDQMLVFANAPFVVQVCRPFALLPYAWAYIGWLVFSAGVYASAVVLLLRSIRLSGEIWKTGFLIAISAMPFLMETWIGGQITVLAFLAFALFAFLRARNRRFLAGLALALAMFKPTLVAIPVLILVCGRRWRMLGGIATGAVALALASIGTVGIKGCVAWVQTVKFYGRLASGTLSAFRRTKYMDVGSFFHLILGDASGLAQVLATLALIAGVAVLAFAWWRSSGWSAPARDLLWAATIAGTLVLNLYTPIYDTILVGIAAALAWSATRGRLAREREALQVWLLLLYLVPWLTQSFAEFLRFQPYTLVLGGFACWALRTAWHGESGSKLVSEDADLTLRYSPSLTTGASSYLSPQTRVSLLCRMRQYGQFRRLLKCFAAWLFLDPGPIMGTRQAGRMKCRYCNVTLAPLRILADGEFCCDEHRKAYKELAGVQPATPMLAEADLVPLDQPIEGAKPVQPAPPTASVEPLQFQSKPIATSPYSSRVESQQARALLRLPERLLALKFKGQIFNSSPTGLDRFVSPNSRRGRYCHTHGWNVRCGRYNPAASPSPRSFKKRNQSLTRRCWLGLANHVSTTWPWKPRDPGAS
jgi:hypothetical protein